MKKRYRYFGIPILLLASVPVIWVLSRSDPQGEPAHAFVGKRVSELSVKFEFQQGKKDERVVSLSSTFTALPFVNEKPQLALFWMVKKPKVVTALVCEKVWLDGDGQIVRIGEKELWRKEEKTVHFELCCPLGDTILFGKFTGAFNKEGALVGLLGGRAFVLQDPSAKSQEVSSLLSKGVWTISEGSFSFSPPIAVANKTQ